MLRHSTAHVLAEAARNIFPGMKITIGPAIDNGFYYDFKFVEAISEDDLARLEAEMHRLLAAGPMTFERWEVSRGEARATFEPRKSRSRSS